MRWCPHCKAGGYIYIRDYTKEKDTVIYGCMNCKHEWEEPKYSHERDNVCPV